MKRLGATRLLSAVVVGLVALLVVGSANQDLAAGPATPIVREQVLATYNGGSLTVTGERLGAPPASRAVRIDYAGRSAMVPAASPLVDVWQDDLVRLSLPPEAQSGQVTVIVDGVESEPVDLFVYVEDQIPVPPSLGTNKGELTVDLAPDGTLWLNQEFHLELKGFSPEVPPTYTAIEIPQVEGPGIFAQAYYGNGPSRVSSLGEDIAVSGEGKVWFTQGGEGYYEGPHFNTSRIVGYDPTTGVFECYNAPLDNAQVIGVLVDDLRGMIWYSESGFASGAAITGIKLGGGLSNCFFDPRDDEPRDPLCSHGEADSCHWRFPLSDPFSYPAHLAMDEDGNIWFTEFFGNAIGRLNPESGEIMELPLPSPIAKVGPGSIVGSGPWEMGFDGSGDLWVAEFFDATLLRVRLGLLETEDCRSLDANGRNPCIEEVLVASDGTDRKIMHTLSVGASGQIWLSVMQYVDEDRIPDTAQVGFVSPAHGFAAAFLPKIEGLISAVGIVQDPASGDVWFTQFWEHQIRRLRQLGTGDADGDGVADLDDNCVLAINPGQEDFNSDGLGDACDAGDDDGDGCPNIAELSANPAQGGRRDPLNFWDFYDVPTGLVLNRDGGIAALDMFAVLGRFSASDLGPGQFDRNSDPLSRPDPMIPGANRANYHPAYDRTSPGPGDDPWDTGPPDGAISGRDFFAILAQFNHECPPPEAADGAG